MSLRISPEKCLYGVGTVENSCEVFVAAEWSGKRLIGIDAYRWDQTKGLFVCVFTLELLLWVRLTNVTTNYCSNFFYFDLNLFVFCCLFIWMNECEISLVTLGSYCFIFYFYRHSMVFCFMCVTFCIVYMKCVCKKTVHSVSIYPCFVSLYEHDGWEMWKIGSCSVVVPGCASLPGSFGFYILLSAICRCWVWGICERRVIHPLPRFTAFSACNIKTAALLDAFDSQLLLHYSLYYYCFPCSMVFALTSLSLVAPCQFFYFILSLGCIIK